jgi:hypothetical protein
LADGIYPRCATFVKTITGVVPGDKKSWFVKCREACKKDVERVFSVLQDRFAVVRFPALTWSKTQMWKIMNACIIMHKMIIKSDREHPMYDPVISHKYRGSCVAFSISKSVEPNEELKVG